MPAVTDVLVIFLEERQAAAFLGAEPRRRGITFASPARVSAVGKPCRRNPNAYEQKRQSHSFTLTYVIDARSSYCEIRELNTACLPNDASKEV